ncbi:MAG TPA: alkaline phosphatase family protein [Gemmatimonadaceae bacterium]
MNVIVLLADGARADWLARMMDTGQAPSMARLRADGALHDVSTVFPSVTGPAYVPFLMGRFPGAVGMPGLRWFDRGRTACHWPDYTRSYVGYQMARVDSDLDAGAPTIFELTPGSVGALSVITRGLSPQRKLMALSPRLAVRAALTHFRGDITDMLRVDREIARATEAHVGTAPYLFAAFGSVDKLSHAKGQDSPEVANALRIVDDALGAVREKLERSGAWRDTRVWITSDHGHSPVSQHEDVDRVVAGFGHRVIAHPWVFRVGADVAVMVSGNAMAHVYVDLDRRDRPFVDGMSQRARALATRLLERPSVDLLLAPLSNAACEVHSLVGGHAIISKSSAGYSYERRTGDPLALRADLRHLSAQAAHAACAASRYPDAIVQIAELATSPRAGDIILSAASGWDFRARYEPIAHVSTHGSLRREHMMVPLLSSRAPARTPLRTVDLMPSALAALGQPIPGGLDGQSFG